MSKLAQVDKLIRELAVKVAVGILTRREAENITTAFRKKINCYEY